ncbi:MAG: type II toxin-antitoxin system RelB/DinJ family antitoxin [Synergistaceae bacterium]|jgi:DNA-damage-inducible protein J|nr:type II toxin-antitoxin system RelB/DinJ family antitoxin [Synergistaceae bacterium]
MGTANINVRTDSEVKTEAAQIFESIGLDMSSAINIFLKQTIQHRNLPFVVGVQTIAGDVGPGKEKTMRPKPEPGAWTGKIWMSDDFDVPLDDFKEYMQ